MGSCFGMGPVGCDIGLLSLLRSAQGVVVSGIPPPLRKHHLFPLPQAMTLLGLALTTNNGRDLYLILRRFK